MGIRIQYITYLSTFTFVYSISRSGLDLTMVTLFLAEKVVIPAVTSFLILLWKNRNTRGRRDIISQLESISHRCWQLQMALIRIQNELHKAQEFQMQKGRIIDMHSSVQRIVIKELRDIKTNIVEDKEALEEFQGEQKIELNIQFFALHSILQKLDEIKEIQADNTTHEEEYRSIQREIHKLYAANMKMGPLSGNPHAELELYNGNKKELLTLGILVDCENLSHNHWANIELITSVLGNCSTKRLYANFQYPNVRPWKRTAELYRLEMIQTPPGTPKKNSSDRSLTRDAEILLSSGEYDGFVIVSSDSGFKRLAKLVAGTDKFVMAIGKSDTKVSFRNECNIFILIDDIPELVDEYKNARRAIPILKKAIHNISLLGEWKPIGDIGAEVYRVEPRFNAKSFGCKGMQDLVSKIPLFEQRRTKGTMELRLRK